VQLHHVRREEALHQAGRLLTLCEPSNNAPVTPCMLDMEYRSKLPSLEVGGCHKRSAVLSVKLPCMLSCLAFSSTAPRPETMTTSSERIRQGTHTRSTTRFFQLCRMQEVSPDGDAALLSAPALSLPYSSSGTVPCRNTQQDLKLLVRDESVKWR
jgi:hypothetical protein